MVSQNKPQLRKQIADARPHSSEGLTQQLISLVDNLGSAVIASYEPMPSEPDVSNFNSLAAERARLLLPRIVGEQIEFAQGQLAKGPFGIMEPTGEAMPRASIDLILVPALAIDSTGNRLGKGKGFYDRALRDFAGTAAAVIFDEELLELVPSEPHDMRVSMVVTPVRTLVLG